MRPAFESVEVSSLDKNTCLVRHPNLISAQKVGSGGDIPNKSNIVVPDTSQVRVLGPASSSAADKSGVALKRKASGDDNGQSLAMVDRYAQIEFLSKVYNFRKYKFKVVEEIIL